MSDTDQTTDGKAPGGKKGLLFGLIGAVVLGAGGFYAAFSGLIGGHPAEVSHVEDSSHGAGETPAAVGFVPLQPLVISLGRGATNRHLKFQAQLEVSPPHREAVALMEPRFLDILNGYLRAVDARDIESPSALGRLRAQMLRRVQVVAGEGMVNDLLITEFVLN